jgi:uncharacterized membrane protein
MSLEPLLHASPVIQIHAAFATLALLLGALQLFRKKGDPVHRRVGTVWVVLMAIVAGSGLFIWTIRVWGPFSPIHLLSIFVLVMLWRGVAAARRHDIATHMKTMQGTYLFGLIITGLLTFVPGRIMYRTAFGTDGATPEKLAIFGSTVILVAVVSWLLLRWRRGRNGAAFVATH